MIKFIVQKDGQPVTQFEQQQPDKEITIGRAPGCSIRLDEDAISRLHALVRHTDDGWMLERKATNGKVFLNGVDVENAVLSGGEEVQIGSFTLNIELSEETGAEAGVEAENEKTSFMAVSSAVGFFRFEPGAANVAEFAMNKDLVVFGRGSNCDVVLSEKRASRKHVEIRRQGLSFFLKDLNSANGTIVNGNSLKGEVELVPGDSIEIGDCRFQFSIENKDFFSNQGDFLPVPAHLAQEADAAEMDEAVGAPVDPNQPQVWDPNTAPPGQFTGIDGFSTEPVTQTEEKSLFKKLWNKYKALPTRQRYLVILIVLAMGTAIVGEEEKPAKKATQTKQAIQLGPDGKPLRVFGNLSENDKKFVLNSYKELLAAQEKLDYPKVLENATKILNYVEDYNQTKSLEMLARKAIDDHDQRERERKQRERLEKIRQEVQVLEEKGRDVYSKALKDSKFRTDLNKLIQEIYSKDPNNRVAQEWSTGIKEQEAEEKKRQELAEQREALRKKAELSFGEVEKIFDDNRYIEALAAAEKLKNVGYSEKEYLNRIEELKERIRTKLASVVEPLLQEAASQRKEGGDLVKSKESYLKVLKVDPQNKDALTGLSDIWEVLHTRAKRMYAEAILAESVSDLAEAREKFELCLRTAPDEDSYKTKCKNKMLKYENFNRELE